MATLNARAGSVALFMGAGGGLALKLLAPALGPILLLCLASTTFGVWCFADEMGIQRPLNRAALVAYCFAAIAKTMLLMGAAGEPGFLVLYSFAILVALLLWSAALLHREGFLKLAGAVGAIASLAPIALLMAGHLVLGVGAFLGIEALYDFGSDATRSNLPVIRLIDFVLFAWAALVAGLMWGGRIYSGAARDGRAMPKP